MDQKSPAGRFIRKGGQLVTDASLESLQQLDGSSKQGQDVAP